MHQVVTTSMTSQTEVFRKVNLWEQIGWTLNVIINSVMVMMLKQSVPQINADHAEDLCG